MKKIIIFKMGCVIVATALSMTMVTTISGCNHEREELVSTTQSTNESFKEALRSLAIAQEKCCKLMFGSMQTRSMGDVGNDGLDSTAIATATAMADSILVAAFENGLDSIDLTADLTETQKAAFYITRPEAELYTADPYAFLNYAQTAKTQEFVNIYSSILSGRASLPSVESIIENDNLSMNEQIGLVVTTVACEQIMVATDINYQMTLTPEQQKCMDNFTRAQGLCTAEYVGEVLIDLAVTFLTEGCLTPWTAGDVVAATAIFIVCVEEAKTNFRNCIKKAK